MIEDTYPSGRKVQNVLDANGDLSVVKSKKNSTSGPFHKYAFNFVYNAAGAVTSMELGNLRYESTVFNSRLQPTQIALGTTKTGASSYDLLKLNYTYGTSGNNGNVLTQTITVPTVGTNNGFAAVQTYTYDSLNRLESAEEMPNGWTDCTSDPTKCWKQTFTFDRYGNRNFDEAHTTFTGFLKECGGSMCTDLKKRLNPSINTSDNRLSSGDDYAFDDAGNTTSDPDDRTFIYDAENKQVRVLDDEDETIGEYWYDGDGKRVKKYVPAVGETPAEVTIFVYDAAGKLVAEYSTIVASTNNAKVAYLTNDHLGSPRINTDKNGKVTARHDYHPFGEEIATSQRTGGLHYTDDTVRKQFTGYERDKESELDFAQARYHDYNLGRFSSPDPLMASGRVSSPQTWNRYSYVGNNPLAFTDPTGMAWYSQRQGNGDTIFRWYLEDPGEDWSKVSDFTYYAGVEKGWIALDPFSANYKEGLSNYGAAFGVYKGRVEAWNAVQFLNGAGDAVSPVSGLIRDAGLKFFGRDNFVDSASTPYRGGWWTGLILNVTAGIVTGAASSTPAAATSLDDVALAQANAAQAAGKTSGAASAMETVSGRVFTGTSGGPATTNSSIQGAINQVDKNLLKDFAGRCAEIRCVEQALNAGEDLTGAIIRTVAIRKAGHPMHGMPKAPCSACESVLKNFGIKPMN
ncbi:MAG: hypothetical protein IPM25_19815 [Chloracidobacterium sp.]|nr:hypothetical protein [Chloracidobacterium sp.]